ncbi:MAG: flagellar basal body protein [Candidatus Eremiobacterota bacterium]
MLEGMRQATDSLAHQVRRLDAVAQNVANVDTPGYLSTGTGRRQGAFAEWLRPTAGAAAATGRSLDVSLEPGSYLAVSTRQGPRYTQRGDLRLDEGLRLVTGAGDPVLDESGRELVLPPGPVEVQEDGTVRVAGRTVGVLGRWRLDRPAETGGTLFTQAGATPPAPDPRPLRTGTLQASNVEESIEQIALVELLRRAQALSQVLSVQDQTLGQAMRDLGRR